MKRTFLLSITIVLLLIVGGVLSVRLLKQPSKPTIDEPIKDNSTVDFGSAADEDTQKLLGKLQDRGASSEERIMAADIIGKARAHEALDLLLIIAGDESEDIEVRYKAARAIGSIGDRQATPVLSKLFLDPHEDTHLRVIAALGLGNLGGEEAVNALSEGVEDEDELIRFKAIQGLERTRDKTAIEHVVKAAGDQDKYVQANALYALGELADPSYVPVVKSILDGTDDDFVKISCLNTLGKLGGSEALSVLETYRNDPSELLRINAEKSIRNIEPQK